MALTDKQVKELNATYSRPGGQTPTDLKNVEFAKTQGYTAPVNVPTTVDVGSLSNVKDPIVPTLDAPQDVENTAIDNTMNAGTTSTGNFYANLLKQQQAPTQAETTRTSLTDQLKSSFEELKPKGTDLIAEQEKLGVSETTKKIQNINEQIAQLTGQYDKQEIAVEGQGRGITTGIVAGQQARIRRQKAIEVGSLATVAQALQGNLALAKQTAQETIDLKYSSIEQEIENQKTLIDLNYQDMTAQQKKRADTLSIQLQARQEEIDNKKLEESRRYDLAVKIAENGASQDRVKSVVDSPNWEEALYNAGESLVELATDELLSPTEASNLGVPYGTTEKQAATMGIVPKSVLNPQDKIDQEFKMSKQVDSSVKESKKSQGQVRLMNTSIEQARIAEANGESLGAASQGILVTFQKILDPTSVVRESEYARSAEGLSIMSQLEGKYQQLKQGGAGVTIKELETFVSLGQELLGNYNQEQVDTLRRTRTQADSWGLKLENIITPEAQGLLKEYDRGKLQDYYSSHPSDQNVIDRIITENPQLDDYDVLKILGSGFSSPLSMGENGSEVSKIASAIGQFESGGNYKAIGPVTSSGDKAYGKYQIMGNNIPSWSKEALGRSITVQEFLNNSQIQDAIAEYKMGKYYQQYGDIGSVATAWFAGPGAVGKNSQAKDVIGTSVPSYVKNVIANYNKIS